jgi:hypothetical protein
MNEPYVNFRHEFVSGAVELFEIRSSVFQVYVANRGGTDAIARAIVWSWHSAGNVRSVKFDGGPRSVTPGEVWSGGFEPDSEQDLNSLFWARILTTSLNLVPSARAFRSPEVANKPPVTDVYISPGDFAVFELPSRPFFPPLPPIGPVSG